MMIEYLVQVPNFMISFDAVFCLFTKTLSYYYDGANDSENRRDHCVGVCSVISNSRLLPKKIFLVSSNALACWKF